MLIYEEFSKKPKIIFEEKEFAILYKPRALPTAPLRKNETETLLNWYLDNTALFENVCGKKDIEAGLLHRLDTATCGLVLIAKTQKAYNQFSIMQEKNLIKKTYTAFCDCDELNSMPDILPTDIPYTITSRFRAYGPKGKKVLPLFEGMRGFNNAKKTYKTTIIDFKKNYCDNLGIVAITCILTQGYRHQVRAHLAGLGFPIYGDALYNSKWQQINQSEIDKHSYPLQLYALGISFPKLDESHLHKPGEYISFLLQPPNKMIL